MAVGAEKSKISTMKRTLAKLALIIFSLNPILAQEKANTAFAEEFLKAWKRHKVYTLRLAEAMPEEHLSYKLDNDTRSFGEVIMHVAGANYMFSSVASGQNNPKNRKRLSS